MTIFVVTKTPVGMDGAVELVGTFSTRQKARDACRGQGTFLIFEPQLDRAYKSGELLDVSQIRVCFGRDSLA